MKNVVCLNRFMMGKIDGMLDILDIYIWNIFCVNFTNSSVDDILVSDHRNFFLT